MAAGRCRDKTQVFDKPGQLVVQPDFLTPSNIESIVVRTSGESKKAFFWMNGKPVTAIYRRIPALPPQR
jgi:hypothetical protein